MEVVGSRVVINGLRKASHLNGKHGTIAITANDNDRRAVDLDNAPQSPRVRVKPTNLIQEPPILSSRSNTRAGCQNGILVESHGRAISNLLDLVRYTVGHFFMQDKDVKDVTDINKLRNMGVDGLNRLNQMIGMGWSHWLDSGSFKLPECDKKGVYGLVSQHIHQTTLEIGPEAMNDPTFQLISKALNDIAAAGGWHIRVHGKFWVVGEDPNGGGTYLIPENNTFLVYKVLGVRNSIFNLLRGNFQNQPVKMVLTMIPWFGRLVYDGVIVGATSHGMPGPPQVASKKMTINLQKAVQKAEEEGRVVERLLELEVEGSENISRDVLMSNIQISCPSDVSESQAELTPKETQLINKLAKFAQPSDHVNERLDDFWVMRRFGYTEEDNPSHIGFIIASTTGLVGQFQCTQGISPVSTDILLALTNVCSSQRLLPTILKIDDKKCFERIKFLFERSISSTRVFYYHPPSVEETNAAQIKGF